MNYTPVFIASLPSTEFILLAILVLLIAYLCYRIINRRFELKFKQLLIDTIIDEHDQLICILDPKGKVVFSNHRFDELLSLPKEKIIGSTIGDLPIKNDLINALTKSDDKINPTTTTHISYNHKVVLFKEVCWLNIQKRTLNLAESDKFYVQLLITDITDKKKVEERLFNAQVQYKQLVESATDVIYKSDIAGNVTYSNKALNKVLGYDLEMPGKINVLDFVYEEDLEAITNYFTSQINEVKDQNYIEYRVVTRSGSIKWLGQTTSVIKDGDEIIGLQSVARDITSKIDAEKELIRAKEIAENASDAKSNFISSLSHEFRTPLNAILGYSQILERNASILPDEKSHIREIKSAGEQLLSMVDDILELTSLDAKHNNESIEEQSFSDYINTFSRRFEELSKSEGLEFNVIHPEELPELVATDYNRLSMVLKNLLDNAIKFTMKGSVELGYNFVASDKREFSLNMWVSDTGTGIHEEDLEQIYNPFWQHEPLKKAGTGLGLTLCKRIIDYFGGSIEAKNRSKGGFEVTFNIPVSVKHNVSVNRSMHIKRSTGETEVKIHRDTPVRVLIVDDLAPNRTITRIILKENGYDFKEAEDGLEALSLIEDFDPDIILMDINMPIMDGIEAMLKIRSRDWKYQTMPILAVTAGDKGGKSELIEQGFTDYLQKPYRENELLAIIEDSLNQNIADLFTDHASEFDKLINSPREVAEYFLLVHPDKRDELTNLLEQQYLQKLTANKLPDLLEVNTLSDAEQMLADAAEKYDFSFLNKVLSHLKDSDLFKS
ncbi:MAG: PAS domain S-box protein [Balneolaceae bacterium]|nr:PAS domain S-box protein [Balneolaceae bacterium]